MSNSLDPDHPGHFASPDLGPNCLQKLSAEDIKGLRVNLWMHHNQNKNGNTFTYIFSR